MRVIAWDTWAFVETALSFSRKAEVQALWRETDMIVTARDVVAETFSFITGKTKGNRHARLWLAATLSSGVRVVDPSIHEVASFIDKHPGAESLRWVDFALAFVAEQAGARSIATEDRGFRQLGFEPVFAPE